MEIPFRPYGVTMAEIIPGPSGSAYASMCLSDCNSDATETVGNTELIGTLT
jgi:hypothetical protein